MTSHATVKIKFHGHATTKCDPNKLYRAQAQRVQKKPFCKSEHRANTNMQMLASLTSKSAYMRQVAILSTAEGRCRLQ